MANYELNLQDYLRILRKRKWIVVTFVTIAFIFSVIYSWFSAPFYQSTTTIKVIERETTSQLLTEMMVWNPGNVMETAAATITSYNIMKSVAEKMGLLKPGMSSSEIDGIVGGIKSEIKSSQIGNTNLIQIIVTSSTPERSYQITKYSAESFIEDSLETKSINLSRENFISLPRSKDNQATLTTLR